MQVYEVLWSHVYTGNDSFWAQKEKPADAANTWLHLLMMYQIQPYACCTVFFVSAHFQGDYSK